MPDSAERRHEPWPWILGTMIMTMMAISIGFAWIAHQQPDPVIVDEAFEAEGGRTGFHPRLVEPGFVEPGSVEPEAEPRS